MSHAQVHVVVHLVWGTRHRTPSLPPSLDLQVEALLAAFAREAKCSLLLAGIASDHVHTLVRRGATASLADLARRMKGGSAYALNERALAPRSLRWQNGYRGESVGPADLDPLVRYLRRQRAHHDDSHPAELWQLAGT
jgi:REP element-mobilizing transposase RayT